MLWYERQSSVSEDFFIVILSMGEQVQPTLLDITRSFSQNGYSPEVIDQASKAHAVLATDPSKHDWAQRKIANALATYAREYADFPTADSLKLYQTAYTSVNQVAKELANEGKTIDSDFGMSVYMELLPVVLGAGRITETRLNGKGNNSMEQVRSVAKMALQAEHIRDEGGEFVIFSPTCSHYNTALANEEGSYDRGLLDAIYVPQQQRVLEPIKNIANVLSRAGVPVRVVIPQVNPMEDPRAMFAMVPAAIWKHIDDHEVAAMILQTNNLSNQFDENAQAFLGETEALYQPASLANYQSSEGGHTTMDITSRLNQLFEDFVEAHDHGEAAPWYELSSHTLRKIIHWSSADQVREAVSEVARSKGWSESEQKVFEEMFASLATPGWGALDDTERFYARESQRRAGKTAEQWRRTFDYGDEVSRLLANSQYFPELSEPERKTRAIHMIENVDRLANVGIGGRAIFNTTVYFALGMQMGDIVARGNGLMCWPVQEATDRQALDAMNRAFKLTSASNLEMIPLIIPNKTRLQPLGVREDVRS
ncbi:hypothetical protein HY469_02420 [Candidatus Roizmanbacteria bacterium]|nr:hypothetical protein [Candidatus Roizmanbacteria bacterium]